MAIISPSGLPIAEGLKGEGRWWGSMHGGVGQGQMHRWLLGWRHSLINYRTLTSSPYPHLRPRRFKTEVIHVKIMDRNDHPPAFGQRQYEVDVDEIAPVHTPLIILNATDTDDGKNAGESGMKMFLF